MKNYPLYIAIFLLLSFGLIFTLIWPKYRNLVSLNEEISKKEFEVESQEKYFQELQQTSEELKKYETSLSKIDSALPQKPFLPELLNFLQKTSSQSGLSLQGISPFPTVFVGGRRTRETRINLILSGGYSEFKNFLSVLEKSARLIEVENISFIFPGEGPFTFNLTIKVYSY
ncbi:MAG: type 4a pilus biogenesis protein PilO [Candidatus Paceibacterales bacterium]